MADRRRFFMRTCWIAAGCALISAIASASDDRPGGSPVPSDPVFEAIRADGSTITGRIRQLGPDGQAVLVTDAGEVAVPFAKLVKLVRKGDPPASPPEGSVIVFPDGDRLRAVVGASNETGFESLPPLLADAPLPIPLDAPLAIILAPPSELSAAEDLLIRVRDEPRDSEVLWLANGDRLSGGFLGLTAQKVSLQREGGDASIDRSGVVALGFDPAVVSYPAPKLPFLELTFLDGSRLGVSECKIDQGHLVAVTRFGATIRPALNDLAQVYVRSESVSYLSDRKEAHVEYVGYLGTHRSKFGRNTTLDGRVLKVAGQPYERGLGTQSRTLLAYRIGPKDSRFQATVGLDDRAGPLGSVVFRVLVDGKEKFVTPSMTVRDAPRTIDLDISKAKILILMTEFGDRGDVQDHADWVDARLIASDIP